MKLMMIPAAALAATFVFAQPAQAREHYRHHGAYRGSLRIGHERLSRSSNRSNSPADFGIIPKHRRTASSLGAGRGLLSRLGSSNSFCRNTGVPRRLSAPVPGS
jgi:hypothetical protein